LPRKLFPKHPNSPPPAPSKELSAILDELRSPDDQVRADAVRKLCPCRSSWDVPVHEQVIALRNDPSPRVRQAVEHDLDENPKWNRRSEARKLMGRQAKQEEREANREIEAGMAAEAPPLHSLAWRIPPRRRSHGKHRLSR
jgi:hypothetical protein